MEANYPAVTTAFKQLNGGGTVITMKNMEVYDGGSVPINFMIETFSQNVTLHVNADVTSHQKAFLQLTCLKAHISFDLQLSSN